MPRQSRVATVRSVPCSFSPGSVIHSDTEISTQLLHCYFAVSLRKNNWLVLKGHPINRFVNADVDPFADTLSTLSVLDNPR